MNSMNDAFVNAILADATYALDDLRYKSYHGDDLPASTKAIDMSGVYTATGNNDKNLLTLFGPCGYT